MRKKQDFFTRFGERLDIPREALPGGFGLTLSGRSELTVRGCKRILEYGSTAILLSLGKDAVRISGEDLFCTVFAAESVTVCGHITSFSFEEVPK